MSKIKEFPSTALLHSMRDRQPACMCLTRSKKNYSGINQSVTTVYGTGSALSYPVVADSSGFVNGCSQGMDPGAIYGLGKCSYGLFHQVRCQL